MKIKTKMKINMGVFMTAASYMVCQEVMTFHADWLDFLTLKF